MPNSHTVRLAPGSRAYVDRRLRFRLSRFGNRIACLVKRRTDLFCPDRAAERIARLAVHRVIDLANRKPGEGWCESRGLGSTIGGTALWEGFILFASAMLAVDLGLFQRWTHLPSTQETLAWSAVWVGLALLFNAGIYFWFGAQSALEFFHGLLGQEGSLGG